MRADVFAAWLQRQGHKVLQTESAYWYEQGPRSYQAFPYHHLIQPPQAEITGFLREHRALSLRYSAPLDASTGCLSYHMVYDQPEYGFESLGKWARKNVRRGLKNCSVEAVPLTRLAKEGYALHLDTLDRQGRAQVFTEESWRNLCLAASDLPGFEGWGAFVSGRLAASVITFRLDNCCYMLQQQCARAHLTAHVNNALSFVVTGEMIRRGTIQSVFYCLHSLDAPRTMDEFKLRMGYTPKPVRQRVVFHPWCSPLVNRLTHRVVKALATLRPESATFAKGEGMMRFYLEGKRPLNEQSVPEALALWRQEHETNNGSPAGDSSATAVAATVGGDRDTGETGLARARAISG